MGRNFKRVSSVLIDILTVARVIEQHLIALQYLLFLQTNGLAMQLACLLVNFVFHLNKEMCMRWENAASSNHPI